MQNVTLRVEGMSCSHCVTSVENAVKKAGALAKVNLSGKTVSVTYDESKLSLQAIKEAIENQGYDVA